MRRQKTQKQLLFSTNQFRGVWVGSSKTLEPVSETKKWEPHPELRTEGAHIIWSKHQQQRLIYVSESSNAKAVRLGKLSTVLGYCLLFQELVMLNQIQTTQGTWSAWSLPAAGFSKPPGPE